jgi:hypothetical protein
MRSNSGVRIVIIVSIGIEQAAARRIEGVMTQTGLFVAAVWPSMSQRESLNG